MDQLPNNAETINALHEAQGALVLALAHTMPAEQKEAFANALARLAVAAESGGRLTLETMLINLAQAARR